MKTKLEVVIVGVFSTLVLMGCQTAQPDSKPREIVPGGIRYPKLLPEEQVRPVTLKLRTSPEFLREADLMAISALVGRVPGLRHYTITLIQISPLLPGGIDVFVDPYNIRMEKDSEWKVVTVSAVFP